MGISIDNNCLNQAEPKDVDEQSIPKLISYITELYNNISKLPSLHPCPQVNSLFSDLVSICIPSYPSFSLFNLPSSAIKMRNHLISICSTAEGHLECHYSSILLPLALSSSSLLPHLPLFPYFSNYLSLSLLEASLLLSQLPHPPSNIAFLGSGPLPLSSIVLASCHFPSSSFDNYDLDPKATAMAASLVGADKTLSPRMEFITADAREIGEKLSCYGAVFLAALVGVDHEQKAAVVEHLAQNMAPGSMLIVRSAHGARMFLYPVVEPADLKGFEVLSVYHPNDEVINSVIVARKPLVQQSIHGGGGLVAANCKCCEKQVVRKGHGGVVVEELGLEEFPYGI